MKTEHFVSFTEYFFTDYASTPDDDIRSEGSALNPLFNLQI